MLNLVNQEAKRYSVMANIVTEIPDMKANPAHSMQVVRSAHH